MVCADTVAPKFGRVELDSPLGHIRIGSASGMTRSLKAWLSVSIQEAVVEIAREITVWLPAILLRKVMGTARGVYGVLLSSLSGKP